MAAVKKAFVARMQTVPQETFAPARERHVCRVVVVTLIAPQDRLANPISVENNSHLAVATKNASSVKFVQVPNVFQDAAPPTIVHAVLYAKVENVVPWNAPETLTVAQARFAKPTNARQVVVAM